MTTHSLAVDFEQLTKEQRIEQTLRYLTVLFPVGQSIEVRIPHVTFKKGFTTGYRGYFDDLAKMAKAVASFNGYAESIYCTLNPVQPALLARSYNEIVKTQRGGSSDDSDIIKRIWLPLDVDPVRPSGISSTDGEHEMSRVRAEEVREWLSLQGWPEPVVGDSGNGTHLLYPIDLPNDHASLLLVEDVIKALDHRFTDETVKVDTTSANAARIWKIYGTLAAKGSDMPERPHRWSHILSAPDQLVVVQCHLLEAIAAKSPNKVEPKPSSSSTGSPGKALDVEQWLQKYGVAYESKDPWRGGTLWNLSKCHFSPDHTDGAWVAQFPSGAIDAGCHHDRCKGKGWRDLREMYEGKREPFIQEESLPELTDEEIIDILSGKAVEGLPFDLYDYRPEDGGVLDAWLDHHGDTWLYVTGYDQWSYWSSSFWQQDRAHSLDREIVQLVSAMNRAAEEKLKSAFTAPDDIRKYELEKARAYIMATKRNAGRINSVTSMARGFRAVPAADMNGGNLLNLHNGTLDLDTFTLHAHTLTDLLNYSLPFDYDPDATAPIWTTDYLPKVFVKEGTTETDPALTSLAQELFGYSLTNDTSLEVMVWLWGDGGNGKTVAIEILKALLGPLATSVDFQNIGLPGNYDLAKLPGMRVAFSTESERGGTVAEGYIKRIASGEMLSARAIYGSPFDFRSTSKIWWAMNDKPIIKSTSSSMWRRLKMLPFHRKFEERDRDPRLREKLMQELPGILNWALEGLARLRANDGQFTQSQVAQQFLDEYEQESNPVGQWLNDRTSPASEPCTSAKGLYADYSEWCKDSGRQAMNDTNFGRELKRMGIAAKRMTAGVKYALYLKPGDTTDELSDTDITESLGL